ncbi:MAG: IS66 family insertion sequence element accessory protein TnpB [Lachnospiraceae bacterium]|nr:IS66 family insertion sequence element accessory protein TnpB [Lachnospiraceae bacterium]
MPEEAADIRRVAPACGTADIRKGINGPAMIIGDKYKQNLFEKGTLFLCCGQRSDRIKGVLWQGTGFLLLYKRLEEDGRLSWTRTTQETAELTEEQFHYLMLGLNPLDPKVRDVKPGKFINDCAEKFSLCILFINYLFFYVSDARTKHIKQRILDAITVQLSFFNEAKACYDEQNQEPDIDEVIGDALKKPRKPKKKGQCEEDLKDFPREKFPTMYRRKN